MAKRGSARARAANRRKRIERDLVKAAGQAGVTLKFRPTKPSRRLLDTIATTLEMRLTAKERRARLGTLKKQLADVLRSNKLRPSDLGAKTVEEVAEILLKMLERVKYGQYTLRELRRKARGLKGIFSGELLELFILNLSELQGHLRTLAGFQLDHLNGLIKRPSKNVYLVNALGQRVSLAGRFSDQIYRATDIWIIGRDGSKRKFIDFGYVSFLGKGAERKIGFLVEGEIKVPRQAHKFKEQLLRAQSRFEDAVEVVFSVEGTKAPLKFAPENIIFSTGSVNRTAVTTTLRTTDYYGYRSVKGEDGFREAYLRIGVTVKMDTVRRITNLLFTPQPTSR